MIWRRHWDFPEAEKKWCRQQIVTGHRQEFSELKIPYNTVVAVDYANLESIGKISYCLRKEETVTAYKNTALNVCWDIANKKHI